VTARPFGGLRVAEFGRYVAVPYAAELFAHGGADVIKFEEIEGTKQSETDRPRRAPTVKARARGLPSTRRPARASPGAFSTCDVVMSNLRPACSNGYLDYNTVSAEAPSIIWRDRRFRDPAPTLGDRDRLP
jgi:crotonobetainyl-CoA:carnitine CoA-transferase CaiB-like acyl-CoA transferase